MRHVFGSTDAAELSRPILPVLRAGFAILSASLGLFYYHGYQHSDSRYPPPLMVPFFALAIAPWFTDIFARRRLLSPSATITHASLDDILPQIVLVFYAGAMAATVWVLVFADGDMAYSTGVALLVIGLGLSFTALLANYLILSGGWLRGFACDQCEEQVWIRSRGLGYLAQRVGLGQNTMHEQGRNRRALCYKCWEKENERERELTNELALGAAVVDASPAQYGQLQPERVGELPRQSRLTLL